MPYFAENTAFSRLILGLLGILAAVVITVAIKDYVVQRRDVTATASTTLPVATSSDAEKKNSPSNKRRARTNTSLANSPAAADVGEDSTASDQVASASANDDAPNPALDLTAHTDRNSRLRTTSGNGWPELLATQCFPLPNLTKPGDVDAPYYQNWAREYCGK